MPTKKLKSAYRKSKAEEAMGREQVMGTMIRDLKDQIALKDRQLALMRGINQAVSDNVQRMISELSKSVQEEKDKVAVLQATIQDQEISINQLGKMVEGRGKEIRALRMVVDSRNDSLLKLEVAHFRNDMG